MEMKFYVCKHCGKIIAIVEETGIPTVCCGDPMDELIPGAKDASLEKHVPVYEVKDNIVSVTVGEEEHPMTFAHYIEWIAIETRNGNQRIRLKPGIKPKACFAICEGDEVESVYAYCNIHGLWKAKP